jgi:hypothetical protein
MTHVSNASVSVQNPGKSLTRDSPQRLANVRDPYICKIIQP